MRTREGCDWAQGLMSQPTVLFGLPPATVRGVRPARPAATTACLYEITWDAEPGGEDGRPRRAHVALEAQLSGDGRSASSSVYATATDLIADTDLDSVLARITERAATAVRAPRYLLALQPDEDAGMRCHYRGFDESRGRELAKRRARRRELDDLPEHLACGGRAARTSRDVRAARGHVATAASSPRSATCSSCTRATPPPRSTAPRRSPRPSAATRRRRPCSSWPAAGRRQHERRGGARLAEAVPRWSTATA